MLKCKAVNKITGCCKLLKTWNKGTIDKYNKTIKSLIKLVLNYFFLGLYKSA